MKKKNASAGVNWPEWVLVTEGDSWKFDLVEVVDLNVHILVEFQVVGDSAVHVEDEEPQGWGHDEEPDDAVKQYTTKHHGLLQINTID